MMLLKAYLVNKLQYIADKFEEPNIFGLQKDIQGFSKSYKLQYSAGNGYSVTRRSRIAEAPTVFARAERQFARERP